MKYLFAIVKPARKVSRQNRNGNIVVLAASVLVMIMAFAAFTIDVGYITLTKSQLQGASDAAALSSALDFVKGHGPAATLTANQVDTLVRQTAVQIAGLHYAGGEPSIYAETQRDVRVGQMDWDPLASIWTKTWGIPPYNMVEVTLRRDQLVAENNPSSNGDTPLPLFFAPVIGHKTANVSAVSTVAMLPGVGFRIVANSKQTSGVLPIAMDEQSWNDLNQRNRRRRLFVRSRHRGDRSRGRWYSGNQPVSLRPRYIAAGQPRYGRFRQQQQQHRRFKPTDSQRTE